MSAIMGPVETSLRQQAIEARSRLWGAPAKPKRIVIPRPVAAPTKAEQVAIAPRVFELPGSAVLKEVCKAHGITVAQLKGDDRRKRFTNARHEAAFKLIVGLGWSYPSAGRALGGRDHTTMINSVKRYLECHPEEMPKHAAYMAARNIANEQRRVDAIRLHFDEGMSVTRLTTEVGAARQTVMGWLLEESERRRMLEAAGK